MELLLVLSSVFGLVALKFHRGWSPVSYGAGVKPAVCGIAANCGEQVRLRSGGARNSPCLELKTTQL